MHLDVQMPKTVNSDGSELTVFLVGADPQTLRRHKLPIIRFRTSAKAHSFRVSSFSIRTRSAGLRMESCTASEGESLSVWPCLTQVFIPFWGIDRVDVNVTSLLELVSKADVSMASSEQLQIFQDA